MTKATEKTYLRSEDRRAATVESVLELAAEHNPQDLTTGQIAARMGLTQGSLFRHFPSKEAIFGAVMDWVSEHLLRRVEDAAVQADGALQSLEAIFAAHVRFAGEHPGVPRLVLGELQNPKPSLARTITSEMLGRYAIVIELQVKRGQARGEIRAELDPALVARQFLATIQGLIVQTLINNRPQALAEMAAPAFALFRDAIEARPTKE